MRAAAILGLVLGSCAAEPAPSQGDPALPGGNVLSAETYTLHRLFQAKKMSLEKFPEAMKDLGIRGISLNDIYFESWDDDYVKGVRAAIERNGCVVTAFIIDRNGDLCMDDEARRRENIEAVKARLSVAKALGAPVVRVNVGKTGRRETDRTIGVERVIAAFKELLPEARRLGIKLLIENHWGPSTYPDDVVRMIRETDPEWVGALLDFKNWAKDADLYESCRTLAPYARHVSAKAHLFDEKGEEKSCDYGRVLRILKEARYRGALSIEFEGPGDPVEGTRKTRDLILRHWK